MEEAECVCKCVRRVRHRGEIACERPRGMCVCKRERERKKEREREESK